MSTSSLLNVPDEHALGNASRFKTAIVLLTVFCSPLVAAQGTPWLPIPGNGDVGISYVHQSADEFWHCTTPECPKGGVEKTPTPGGGKDLRLSTLWLSAGYGISDNVALDAQLGWAKSDYAGAGPKKMGADSLNGIADFNVGLRWRITDELISDWPSIALRVGAILAGNYDIGYINSLGDGGDGLEASVIVGKFVSERVGVSGELGYRNRNNGIPAETFLNLSGLAVVNEAVSLGVDYRRVNASGSGIEIGGPGFSPARFPEVEEDASMLAGRMFWQLADSINLSMFYGKTLDGRNTAASNAFGVTLGRSFSRD